MRHSYAAFSMGWQKHEAKRDCPELEDWTKFEEVYFVNRHFERLLLEVGVFPDRLEDGTLYIHTSGEHRLNIRLGRPRTNMAC